MCYLKSTAPTPLPRLPPPPKKPLVSWVDLFSNCDKIEMDKSSVHIVAAIWTAYTHAKFWICSRSRYSFGPIKIWKLYQNSVSTFLNITVNVWYKTNDPSPSLPLCTNCRGGSDERRGLGGGKGGDGKEMAFQPIWNFLFKSSTDDPKSHLTSFVKKTENMVKIILWVVFCCHLPCVSIGYPSVAYHR